MAKYINQTLKLPTKGRKASCDVKAFVAELKKHGNSLPEILGDSSAVSEKLLNDASIEVCNENICEGWNFYYTEKNPSPYDPDKLNVEKITIDGKKVPVLKGYLGGDWEQPVAFIIYLGEKGSLRLYTPRRGNIFNVSTKSAFGNDEDADETFLKSIGVDPEEIADPEIYQYDQKAMLEDIQARLIAC